MLPLPDQPSCVLDVTPEVPAALPVADGQQAPPALAAEHAELQVYCCKTATCIRRKTAAQDLAADLWHQG